MTPPRRPCAPGPTAVSGPLMRLSRVLSALPTSDVACRNLLIRSNITTHERPNPDPPVSPLRLAMDPTKAGCVLMPTLQKPPMERTRPSAANARRRATARETFSNAKDAIGPITDDTNLFLLTRGQFSMLDMVRHALDQLGPAAVSVWTWAIADYEVEAMTGLMADQRITSARLIVDRSAEQRNVTILDTWRQRFGAESVRVCKNHAKIARVWTDDRRVLLRGSMNLNFNPRFEQADITVNGDDFDLIARVEDELPVLPALCSNADAENASKLSRAFELGELAMFSGMKVWAK